jgi:ATP-binding cassette subfamily E protein 1
VGVVGKNATGKTTFVRMLAGEIAPTEGKIESTVEVSYKPQYLERKYAGTVREWFYETLPDDSFESAFFKAEVAQPLGLEGLWERAVESLSGGELQLVAIARALAQPADLYLKDEPSAYLDSNLRMLAAKTIRRMMAKCGAAALIVDHDVYFLDMVSDSLMVFRGESGVYGRGGKITDLRTGMNLFLEDVGVTFRRDVETHRPRINKLGSKLDREQKAKGEYYYT